MASNNVVKRWHIYPGFEHLILKLNRAMKICHYNNSNCDDSFAVDSMVLARMQICLCWPVSSCCTLKTIDVGGC